MTLDRRTVLATSLTTAAALATPAALARSIRRDPRPILWTFDNLRRIGSHVTTTMGDPKIVATPLGRAVQFDGIDDALFIDSHPLAGAVQFTFEALFRPDGGAFEQRWFHLESMSPGAQPPDYDGSRMLFEVRVKNDLWWIDTFLRGEGYRAPLIDATKTWPVGRWAHVAQTCDGSNYRAYVNGVLQAEAQVAFKPQGPGKASVGIRYTKNWPFKGLVRQAAFTRDAALPPERFVLPVPRG